MTRNRTSKEMVRYDYEIGRRHREDQELSSVSLSTVPFSLGSESGSDDDEEDDDNGDGSGSESEGSKS